jgi:hypothetical protein
VRLWVALALVCALIAGCGDDSAAADEPAADLAVPWIDPDGDPPIVGSLAVNPADSTLFMATNTGLFRIPEGASKPERVVGQLETPDGSGEVSEALVVRFVGPDTLLGSGHPAAGSALPQALGLIRSEDAGKTWTAVSELGTADFHAIEPAGDDIVGALFQQPQVLVSADEGKTWETRAAPLPLVALEVNPQDPQLWVGSTDRGIFASRYREDRGSTGGEPQAMTVDDSGNVYVALIDGTLKVSDDGGKTFTDQIKGA